MDLSAFYSIDASYVKPYGMAHVIYLIFCFISIFIFIKNSNFVKTNSSKIAKIIFGISLFQQVFLLYGWYAVVSGFDLSVSLPLHICRVANILSLIFLINRNKKYLDVIFYFSIFALSSLFYPMNVYNFAHISGVSYMINHLLTVLMPIFAAIAFDWKPTWQGLKRGLIAFTIYLVVVFFIDPILGSNYFYLIDRPFWSKLSYETFALVAFGITISGYSLITLIFNFDYSKYFKFQKMMITNLFVRKLF